MTSTPPSNESTNVSKPLPTSATTPPASSTLRSTAVAPPPASKRSIVASLAFALAIAAAGYAWKGAPSLINPDPATAATGEGGANHTMDPGQFAELVGKLEQRLANEPGNLEGWTMLARSYIVLDRGADAAKAYARAVALAPDDPNLLADYADALATIAPEGTQRLEGEPGKLIDRALAIDGSHPKALALAGTRAYDRGDFVGAARTWERVVTAHPDHPFAPQLRASIDEARARAAPPGAPAPADARPAAGSGAAPSTSTAVGGAGHVSGRVTLAPALAARAAPDDTVFVFARAADGPRMPLAIVRRQVKDLPLDFKLDDAMAMSPQMKLSNFAKVIVGARISKSGNATPQSGDLQGMSKPVDLGAKDIAVVIDDVLAK